MVAKFNLERLNELQVKGSQFVHNAATLGGAAILGNTLYHAIDGTIDAVSSGRNPVWVVLGAAAGIVEASVVLEFGLKHGQPAANEA